MIEECLKKILESRYGKDVRDAIHDSIKEIYEIVKNADVVKLERIVAEHEDRIGSIESGEFMMREDMIAINEALKRLNAKVDDVVAKGLSAEGIPAKYTPTALGDGTWEWQKASGGGGILVNAMANRNSMKLALGTYEICNQGIIYSNGVGLPHTIDNYNWSEEAGCLGLKLNRNGTYYCKFLVAKEISTYSKLIVEKVRTQDSGDRITIEEIRLGTSQGANDLGSFDVSARQNRLEYDIAFEPGTYAYVTICAQANNGDNIEDRFYQIRFE